MAVKFIPIDRDTAYLLPPCVQDYLPEEHLARFVVEVVEQLDVSRLSAVYRGTGSRAYHPAMLLSLLFYGYATGTFSSRKLEKATYDSIACRYICANEHPDHDSINSFRKRFLKEIESYFLDILLIAKQMGVLKLGTVSLDGTKVKANASKHKALSWKYAKKLEAQLKKEVDELMRLAEEADQKPLPEALDIPQELKRREERLEVIKQAKQEIERRAQERYEQEKAEYDQKMAKRQAQEAAGKKPRGSEPKAPASEPRDKDQVNLTDEESRIMPTSGGGFEQVYNAQAAVDVASGLVITRHVTQASNDKQQLEPTLKQLGEQEKHLGQVEHLLADTGYFSEKNVSAVAGDGIAPYIARGRERHNPPLLERFEEPPTPPEGPLKPVDVMSQRMKTQEGKALYGRRKGSVEPAFGIIKHVQGFRQFLLRGLDAVSGEWNLVCIGYNLKRMFAPIAR